MIQCEYLRPNANQSHGNESLSCLLTRSGSIAHESKFAPASLPRNNESSTICAFRLGKPLFMSKKRTYFLRQARRYQPFPYPKLMSPGTAETKALPHVFPCNRDCPLRREETGSLCVSLALDPTFLRLLSGHASLRYADTSVSATGATRSPTFPAHAGPLLTTHARLHPPRNHPYTP